MLAMTLGNGVSRNFKSPGTSAKSMAMLRSALLEAQEYQKKMKEKDPEKAEEIIRGFAGVESMIGVDATSTVVERGSRRSDARTGVCSRGEG